MRFFGHCVIRQNRYHRRRPHHNEKRERSAQTVDGQDCGPEMTSSFGTVIGIGVIETTGTMFVVKVALRMRLFSSSCVAQWHL